MKKDENIVLVGFMGTGKTAVGKILARKLSLQFIDTDDEIEKRVGLKVYEIFKEHGERYFREKEREVVKGFAKQKGAVIATGGGVMINPHNVDDLKKNGVIICLTATPKTILSRVREEESRPLLTAPDKLRAIKDLLESRKAFYALSDISLDTTGKEVSDVVWEIEEALRKKALD